MTAQDASVLWAGVDALTNPIRHRIERDDGTVTWVNTPCLLDQAYDALVNGGGELNIGAAGGAQAERSLFDFELMEIHALIANTTLRSLRQRGQVPTPDRALPGHVRQLAAYVVGHEPDRLWWWEYRFTSWARLLTAKLRVAERVAASVRLRNSRCPKCATAQVIVEASEGRIVVPAILVEFRNGYVRAAQCQACGHMWWRGDDLIDLARSLGIV